MVESHTIDANTEMRMASQMARQGKRYYPVDESYDKRVYENTPFNWFRIVVTLIGFWIFNAFHWWGVLALGLVHSEALGWYSIACFFFTIFFLGGMLVSGKYANKKKREHDFFYMKITELKSEEQDRQTKQKQAEEHERKIAEQKAREDALAAQAAAEAGVDEANPPVPQPAPGRIEVAQNTGDGRLI